MTTSTPSINQKPQQTQSIKQIQRLIMSPRMQQAIHLLQMPVQELSSLIDAELEQNPVMESEELQQEIGEETELTETPKEQEAKPEQELIFDERDFALIKHLDDEFRDYLSDHNDCGQPDVEEESKRHTFLENSVQMQESLFEHLMSQARETFNTPEQLVIAEEIIGNLDNSGFLKTPISEIATLYNHSQSSISDVLKEIQQFDPNGVGALSLQDSLQIQLAAIGKKESLAYKIITLYYDDLLHNRIAVIKKKLKTSSEKINQAIDRDISKLDLHPGASYSRIFAAPIIPDATIIQENDHLVVVVNSEHIPRLRINQQYLRMLDGNTLNNEEKEFIKNKILSAKWLLRTIFQRNNTIERIAESLAKRHRDFFMNPNGTLTPLTMKTIAEELSLNESTIARAVANKYINTPRGIFSLRHFFNSGYIDKEGNDVSSSTVRDVLKTLINGENKSKPLSDEALSTAIKAQGIPCARRTIAKYRAELKIGNTQQRRKFSS